MLTREEIICQLTSSQPFDLIVIGGGVTGAGIALDAAARGLRTALLEKGDYASGTSSKSTKLIHGGLRYLKQLEFGLVREVGQERAIVHRLAPHLVKPEKMLLPLVKNGAYGYWATSFGLWVYDWLAGVKDDDRRQMLSKTTTCNLEPLFAPDVVIGGGYYAEYRTDDARLTVELVKTAASYGAICLNYARVTGLLYGEERKIKGVKFQDEWDVSAPERAVEGQVVVSAAGPWVDELRSLDQSLTGKRLFLSKGVHLVVDHGRFPIRQAVYFDAPDGRMIFAIPRGRATYFGTTDTPYSEPPETVHVNRADADYLLGAVNAVFPGISLNIEDVESSWAGLRPLIYEPEKSASEMSRRDELFESHSGLISIAGGKLTGYRRMAERVVNRVAVRLGRRMLRSQTRRIPLCGGIFTNARAVADYEIELSGRLAMLGIPTCRAAYLVCNYGRQAEMVLSYFEEQPECEAERELILAEVRFAIRHEQACHPLDWIERRSGRLYFDLPATRPYMGAIIDAFSAHYHWSDKKRETVRLETEKTIFDASHFV